MDSQSNEPPADRPEAKPEEAEKNEEKDRQLSLWIALGILIVVDLVLLVAFGWGLVVYNCHGGYECPF